MSSMVLIFTIWKHYGPILIGVTSKKICTLHWWVLHYILQTLPPPPKLVFILGHVTMAFLPEYCLAKAWMVATQMSLSLLYSTSCQIAWCIGSLASTCLKAMYPRARLWVFGPKMLGTSLKKPLKNISSKLYMWYDGKNWQRA